MRRLLPALFLASAALLGAESEVSVRVPGVAVVADRVLPLNEAIDRALTHNLGLAVTRLDAASAHDAVIAADAEFDASFGWSNTLRRGSDPVSRSMTRYPS